MISDVNLQLGFSLYSLSIGIILGFLYDITYFGKLFKRAKWFFVLIFDLLFIILASGVYIIINYHMSFFQIKWYMILMNLLGFILQRKSFAILLAKFYKIVYNLIIKGMHKQEKLVK